MFNVATVVHGYEALLAIGFIFTIHFFNAHLRLEKFPVDAVMFTGSLPEAEFREERRAQYTRLAAQDALEALRVAPPERGQRLLAVLLGIAGPGRRHHAGSAHHPGGFGLDLRRLQLPPRWWPSLGFHGGCIKGVMFSI